MNTKTLMLSLSLLTGAFAGDYTSSVLNMPNETWKEVQKREFGTLREPRYKIRRRIRAPDEFLAYQMELAEKREKWQTPADLAVATTEDCLEVAKEHESLDTLLPEIEKREKWIRHYLRRHNYEFRRNLPSQDEVDGNIELDPLRISKEIFYQLTGQEIPGNIAIVKKPRGHARGKHRQYDGIVEWDGVDNVDKINTLLHELGHVISQQSETIDEIFSEEIEMEEASAYAFTYAGGCAAPSEIAEIMNRKFERHINYWITREDDPHGPGARIFYVTRHVLNDPAETYNLISTSKNSSELVEELKKIDENRWIEGIRQVRRLDKGKLEELNKKLELLKNGEPVIIEGQSIIQEGKIYTEIIYANSEAPAFGYPEWFLTGEPKK